MSDIQTERIDEVSKHYDPAKTVDCINKWIFGIIIFYSIIFPNFVTLNDKVQSLTQTIYIIIVYLFLICYNISNYIFTSKKYYISSHSLLI